MQAHHEQRGPRDWYDEVTLTGINPSSNRHPSRLSRPPCLHRPPMMLRMFSRSIGATLAVIFSIGVVACGGHAVGHQGSGSELPSCAIDADCAKLGRAYSCQKGSCRDGESGSVGATAPPVSCGQQTCPAAGVCCHEGCGQCAASAGQCEIDAAACLANAGTEAFMSLCDETDTAYAGPQPFVQSLQGAWIPCGEITGLFESTTEPSVLIDGDGHFARVTDVGSVQIIDGPDERGHIEFVQYIGGGPEVDFKFESGRVVSAIGIRLIHPDRFVLLGPGIGRFIKSP